VSEGSPRRGLPQALRLLTSAAICILCIWGGSCREYRTGGPSILLIILDSARADHFGCYGYSRNTSPVIDSLAAAGTVFLTAQSQAPWTLPAVATVLTGLVPQVHGVGEYRSALYGLDDGVPYLPEMMQKAGYHTFGEFCIAWLGPDFGFDRGFDALTVRTGRALDGMIDESTDRFSTWLDGLPEGGQFFAVVHVFEMHNPFDPEPPWDTLFVEPGDSVWAGITAFEVSDDNVLLHPEEAGYLISQYDGEIAMADAGIGRLLAALRSRGLGEGTVVILVADHGEEFAERGGYDHGHTLYQEMLHVPLVFAGPGIPRGERRTEPVGQFDIVPSVLALAGAPAPRLLNGIDLFSGAVPDRVIPSGQIREGLGYSVRRGDLKLVLDSGENRLEAFDLAADPGETNPLPSDSVLADSLMKYVTMEPIGARSVVLDEDAARALRDLGYI
jgi:arylsulfatase A-like enzyme